MAAQIAHARPFDPSTQVFAFGDHHSSPKTPQNAHARAFRSRAATVSQRPRTSSGPEGSRVLKKSHSTRRISRDDLHLAEMVSRKTSPKSYHIPIRGKAPSPDSSPNSRSRSPPTTLVRTITPDSQPDTGDGIIAIGMALGSPSQLPATFQMSAKPPMMRAATSPAVVRAPEDTSAGNHVEPKPKSRKWGFFGMSKSRKVKPAEIDSPLITGQPSRTPPAHAGHAMHKSPEPADVPVPRHVPLIARSQTAPVIGEVPKARKVRGGEAFTSHKLGQTTRKPVLYEPVEEERKAEKKPERRPEKRSERKAGEKLERIPERVPELKPVPPMKDPVVSPKAQLLNVEIPSVELERYSIMFGSVLQPNRGSSSLLARRQATLEKLRTLRDTTAREEAETELKPPPRRATSPSPGRSSPSFSLFPSTPSKVGTSQRPFPRGRSNTSPAFLPSPSQPNFDPQEAQFFLERSITPSQTPTFGPRPHASSNLRTPQVMVESPGSIAEERQAGSTGPSPVISQAAFTPRRGSRTAPATSASSPLAIDKPEETEAQRVLREAVEKSIRRQISLSQQQRSMLRPQHVNASPISRGDSPKTGGLARSLSRIHVGGDERLAETKSSTPTLVHPGSADSFSRDHRKSERIVLESA